MILKIDDNRLEYIITLYQVLKEIDEKGPQNVKLFEKETNPEYFNFQNSIERQNFSTFRRLVHSYQLVFNEQSVENQLLKDFFDNLYEKLKYPLSDFDMKEVGKLFKEH